MQEPEYIGVFMGLKENGDLVELERVKTELKIRVKALGFGGGEGALQIPGERSSIRFKSGENIQFVVRAPSQQTDPMTLIQFYSFESKKGVRKAVIVKVGAMGMSSKSTLSNNAVPFNVAKHGESSFRIVVSSTLPPGEYFFGVISEKNPTTDVFCFGIDPAENK